MAHKNEILSRVLQIRFIFFLDRFLTIKKNGPQLTPILSNVEYQKLSNRVIPGHYVNVGRMVIYSGHLSICQFSNQISVM